MTSANPVDPNSIRLTGENSFIRLVEGDEQTTRSSHWRVLYSPGGAGHVLFLKSHLVDGVRVYADNIALARWLQEEIESLLFPEFADQSLQVIEAEFSRKGRHLHLLDGDHRKRRRPDHADVARFPGAVHAHRAGGQRAGPSPRGIQLLHPVPLRPHYRQRR